MTKIAVFQMSAAIESAARPQRITDAMAKAAEAGARLMIAPELALSGYGRGAPLTREAQRPDGPWAQALGAAAAKHGISVIAGFPEDAGELRHISAMMVDRTRPRDVTVYRKGCLYGPYEKGLFTAAGPSTIIADMEGLKVGCLICYDVEFPENVRRLAVAGADLIAVPTALPKDAASVMVARHTIRARAFESQVFIAYADNSDADEGFAYQGLSSIAAPDGSVLAEAGEGGDALIYADLDPATYADSNAANPYLEDAAAQGLI
ncbi:nitrilase-related carbon-nitrogen hydrolase [Roseovarius sp. Pro17]|uniref:nitrilase-related carbon-nitrogen hydrolase n=1 Tax=Roseovarius sp. Pro17 TaxID=3108175 RepID=UPI002D79ADBA|nr:nitrilase-related carbon-nitrogen hydrolase [Roseovarius sp. Pro17]